MRDHCAHQVRNALLKLRYCFVRLERMRSDGAFVSVIKDGERWLAELDQVFSNCPKKGECACADSHGQQKN